MHCPLNDPKPYIESCMEIVSDYLLRNSRISERFEVRHDMKLLLSLTVIVARKFRVGFPFEAVPDEHPNFKKEDELICRIVFGWLLAKAQIVNVSTKLDKYYWPSTFNPKGLSLSLRH